MPALTYAPKMLERLRPVPLAAREGLPEPRVKVGNYSITQNGSAADKTAKDNNFRGETVFNNTLYVADEGNQSLSDTAANNLNAGLEKYSLINSSWTLDYTLQAGLNLDQMYGVAGLPAQLDPATDGLRNLTGTVNSDGSVSLFGITSTVSASGDQGADPNKLVGITDTLAFTTPGQAANESFTTLQSAGHGEVLRGVAFAPTAVPPAVPEAPSSALLGAGILGLLGVFLRKRRAA